jgi:hypothetical protein
MADELKVTRMTPANKTQLDGGRNAAAAAGMVAAPGVD